MDDNSTDGTREIINRINKNNEHKVVYRNNSKSLASAFTRALIETTGDYIGWVDTNMAELSKKFPEMIKCLQANYDLILLSRYINGGGDERILIRSLCSKYFNIFCTLLLRSSIKDYTSSIFVMKREVLNEVTFLGYGHGDFFIEFLFNAYQKGFSIKEIPYVQKKDIDISASKSAPNLVKFLFLGIMYVLRIFTILLRRKN